MSNFVVSARKYRPIKFVDVVGQEHVTTTLKNALKNDHLAHAFLFCGPRGVGKTTCARILAKVLNCQNVTDQYEPCNVCDSCKSFNKNASFNITELDAASNNSVEHIRTLIEQVRFQPQQGDYKVFIIDEVHMLSQQAFNAFLKTLEEPPSYAIFILATTEKHKIIPTILSRCQIFDFKRIQIPKMVSHLQSICAEEGIEADDDALHIIGQKADGALRDALSIFDRIVSFSGNRITYEDVVNNLNILDYDYYFQLVDAFLTEDFAKVMNTFDGILRKGFDPDIFVAGLAEHIRDILVCKDQATLKLLEVSDRLKTRYQQQAALAPTAFLLTALNLLNQCDVNYKMARNKRLHVEMCLIKITYIHQAIDLSKGGVANVPEKKNIIPQPAKTPPLVVEASEVKTPEQAITAKVPLPQKKEPPKTLKKLSSKYSNAVPTLGNSLEAMDQVATTESKLAVADLPPLEIATIQQHWQDYMTQSIVSESVKPSLKSAELRLIDEKIIATVGTKMAAKIIREERALLEKLRTVFKRPQLIVSIKIDESKSPKHTAPKVKKPLTPKEKFEKMVEQNPLVQDLVGRFDLTLDE